MGQNIHSKSPFPSTANWYFLNLNNLNITEEPIKPEYSNSVLELKQLIVFF